MENGKIYLNWLSEVIPVNWTIEVIIGLISTILIFLGFLTVFIHYIKVKYHFSLYLAMAWFSLMLWCLLQSLAYLFLSISLFLIVIYVLIPMGFSVVLFVDAISRETVDSKKLVAMTTASVFMIFVSLNPNMISTCMSCWGLSLCMEEDLRIVVSIVGFLISAFLIYYSIKIHLVAPKNLKVHSKWFLIGMFLIGVVGSLSVITELTLIIPAINQLVMAIGACICAWVMAVQPKLAYILPFKVYRLMVMETEKGTPLYVYDWIKSDVELNNELFSRMIHAMNKITEKSMQSSIREIHLDQDIFIIQRSTQFEVVCLLVTSKSSQFLRDALNSFAKKFFTKFSKLLSNPSKEDDFESASELIREHFAFVP